MLKQNWRVISRLERIGDNVLIVSAFFLAYYFRDSFFHLLTLLDFVVVSNVRKLGRLDNYLLVLGVALPVFNAALPALGAYQSMRQSSLGQILKVSFVSALCVFVAQGALFYMLKIDTSRSFVVLFCLLSGCFLFFERWAVLLFLRFFRSRGKNFRNVLIVGTGSQALTSFAELTSQPEYGIRVVGFVSVGSAIAGGNNRRAVGLDDDIDPDGYHLPMRVVANEATFERALKEYAVDNVLFTNVLENFSVTKELAEIAVEEGVRVSFTADFFSLKVFRSRLEYLGNIPLIQYELSPGSDPSVQLLLKRVIDIVVSASLLLLLWPLFTFTAIAIRLESKGPVFFRQKRVGLNGRTFTLYKFRSMVEGAESLRLKLEALNEMTGPVFKLKADPRVTGVGKFLRTSSIDELPQLWNVLKGDMSLVGPRPPLPEEVALYLRKQRRRLSMRPGLTCIWQVSGRNQISDFSAWAELDLHYIDTWTLGQDFKLLFKTIPAVFRGR